MVAGVDGCHEGWMVAADRGDGKIKTFVISNLRELLADHDLGLVVIDIAIDTDDQSRVLAKCDTWIFAGDSDDSITTREERGGRTI